MDNETREVDLREVLVALQRRGWIVIGMILLSAVIAVLVTIYLPRIYEANSQISVKAPVPEGGALLAGLSGGTNQYKQTQMALLQNRAVEDEVLDRLAHRNVSLAVSSAYEHSSNRQIAKREAERKSLEKMLTFVDRPDTDLIDIKVRSTDPHLAMAIAEETPYAIRDYKQKVANEAARRDVSTMRQRVQQARDAMRRSTDAVSAFQNRNGIADLTEQTKHDITELSTLKLAVGDAQRNLYAALSRFAKLQQQLSQQNAAIRARGERSDVATDQLRTLLTEQQTNLLSAEQRYVNFPAVTAGLKAAVDSTQQRLNEELKKSTGDAGNLQVQEKIIEELQGAELELPAAREQYDLLNGEYQRSLNALRKLPAQENQFVLLSQDADVDRELYKKILESSLQIDINRLAHFSEVEISQPAELPIVPILPRPVMDVSLGLFLGFVLGLGLALLLDHLDDSIHSEAQLRQWVGEIPLLASLPKLPSNHSRPVERGAGKEIQGPYRSLWSNLEFASIDHPIRSLVVTSTVQGEGKSLTCANLARAAAEEGKRIVLVDCDLRRPSQHRNFHVSDAMGVCEVLSGKISLEAALLHTEESNLTLLPAGKTLPLNPAVLLKSERMAHMIEELLQRFDFVLIDAPPAVAITDALMLAARCDGLMQVVEAGRAKREHIRKVIEAVRRARARHIGVVLNKVRIGAFAHNYYYYESHTNQNGDRSNGVRK